MLLVCGHSTCYLNCCLIYVLMNIQLCELVLLFNKSYLSHHKQALLYHQEFHVTIPHVHVMTVVASLIGIKENVLRNVIKCTVILLKNEILKHLLSLFWITLMLKDFFVTFLFTLVFIECVYNLLLYAHCYGFSLGYQSHCRNK